MTIYSLPPLSVLYDIESEEFYLFIDDFAKQLIGKTAGSKTQHSVVEPFLTKNFFYDSVVGECVFYCLHPSCRFRDLFVSLSVHNIP